MSILNVATIQSNAAATPPVFQDSAGVPIGTLCRAWVYFNATTGTPVILGSFNVSSITDNAVGDFTINFTTPMPNTNYCTISAADAGGSVSPRTTQSVQQTTTSSVSIGTRTFAGGVTAGATADMSFNKVAIFA